MKVRLLRVAVPALVGAALALLLFALVVAGRFLLRGEAPSLDAFFFVELIVLVTGAAALGAGSAALSQQLVRSQYRKMFAELKAHVADLRNNPAPHALLVRGGALAACSETKGICDELELLVTSYRKALAAVVETQETIDLLASPESRNAVAQVERNQTPMPRYVGSSRHRMVARLAPNLHWIAATPPLLQFLGSTTTHLVARSFLDLVHRDDAAALRRSLDEAVKDGEGHDITFRVRIPEYKGPPPSMGSDPELNLDVPPAPVTYRERHLQMDVMTCYNDAGMPLHLRCHLLDITERVKTEQELRRRTAELSQANDQLRQINADVARLKESYRDLYHHAPVIYFGLDSSGQFVAFNETMLRTLGYARDELLAHPYTRLLPPASREAFLGDPSVFQHPGELETQWLKRDGTIIDVWIATTTIRDEKGNFVRSRSVARDVTERNRLANDLRTKAAELEEAIARLRRINQELEEFTYVVSHDLKEPLRTLEAFSNFLAQDYGSVLGTEGHEYISHLILASRRLGRLIDDLLILSRAGRVINTPHAFNWDATIRTVVGDLHDLIQRQQATVRVEGSLPAVIGDPERIMQLLANLVSNALKYNKSQQPEVVIGAAPAGNGDGPAPGFAVLFVRDNGIGIEPQYHEQIFRMFRRLHRREEVEGTGAGLAICKKIVEAHGGRIWVESQPGQGATFYFTLPRVQGPTVRAPSTQLAREPRRAPATLAPVSE